MPKVAKTFEQIVSLFFRLSQSLGCQLVHLLKVLILVYFQCSEIILVHLMLIWYISWLFGVVWPIVKPCGHLVH
jgi:hypothetical protein